MKTTALVMVLAIAVALGYLLGTEGGRERKETLMVKLGRGPDGELQIDEMTDIIEDAAST